jgi:hypothetical protein
VAIYFDSGGSRLVFKRNDGAAIAAEGRNFLKIAVRRWDCHDWTITKDRMTGGGKIPAAPLGTLRQMTRRLARRLRGLQFEHRQAQQQG